MLIWVWGVCRYWHDRALSGNYLRLSLSQEKRGSKNEESSSEDEHYLPEGIQYSKDEECHLKVLDLGMNLYE